MEVLKMSTSKQKYIMLLDLLMKANDSINIPSFVDINERERMQNAHDLVNKFIGHALTILAISNEIVLTDLPSFPTVKFTDTPSIDVLSRSAMETFLAFYWIFYSPKNKEEAEFRYLVYKVAGMIELLDKLKIVPKLQNQYLDLKTDIEKIRVILNNNPLLNNLSKNQRNSVFKKGKWNYLSWAELAKNAGFSRLFTTEIYRDIIGTSHSSSLSIAKMNVGFDREKVDRVIRSSISIMVVITANMIVEYCQVFSDAQRVLFHSGMVDEIREYVDAGKSIGDDWYKDSHL